MRKSQLVLSLIMIGIHCLWLFLSLPAEVIAVEGVKFILIDEGHSSYLDSGNLEILIQNLEDSGYVVQTLTGEITFNTLCQYSALVVGTAWGVFTQEEINAIEIFVRKGGGLMLTGVGWSWVAYHPESSIEEFPMNQIASRLGSFFNNDIIYDPTDYLGGPARPIFHTPYITSHPVTAGVSEACASGYPCSISNETGLALIRGDEDSYGGYGPSPYPDPGSHPPFLVAIEFDLGRVVMVGHEGPFHDVSINNYNHQVLAENIIDWIAQTEFEVPHDVIPEVPWGTITTSVVLIIALATYFTVPKLGRKNLSLKT